MSRVGSSDYSGVSRHSAQDPRSSPVAGSCPAEVGEGPSSASPRALSDRELLSRVKDLVSRERAVTLEILAHLNEVERRRLHVGLGYASMFDYCTRHLGYSSSAASRRIQSARCVRNYPEVYALLEKNEVNLVTISLVASILTEANAKELLGKIRGESQREVEAVVAAYRPPVSMRDRAKPVCVVVSTSSRSPLSGSPGELTPTAGSEKRPNITASGMAAGPLQPSTETQAPRQAGTQPTDDHPTASMPRLEARFFVQFLASPRFMQKLERAKALLSNRNGELSHEFVLEAALDEFLKVHGPEERKQRREERKHKTEARTKSGKRAAGRTAKDRTPRRVPAATRDAVFARDKGRCTYVGSNGERCAAAHHLQIDHIVPYARGGTNSIDNLRLLCERHNQHEAERALGANTVRRFSRRE